MKLGIMQPYFFPYLGYWQLLNVVDKFVVLDDVSYIKRGWINRNRILVNSKPSYFTMPINKVSQNSQICDLTIHEANPWRKKILRSIEITYSRAPFFNQVFPQLENIIGNPANNLADYLLNQLSAIAALLNIETKIVPSSRKYENDNLSGERRIIDICRIESAGSYINLESGQVLYRNEAFHDSSVDLEFLKFNSIPYSQRVEGFVSHLSIIDVLMELAPKKTANKLNEFEVIRGHGI